MQLVIAFNCNNYQTGTKSQILRTHKLLQPQQPRPETTLTRFTRTESGMELPPPGTNETMH